MPFTFLVLTCYGSLALILKPVFWPRQNQLHTLALVIISEKACNTHKKSSSDPVTEGPCLQDQEERGFTLPCQAWTREGVPGPATWPVCQFRNGATAWRRGRLSPEAGSWWDLLLNLVVPEAKSNFGFTGFYRLTKSLFSFNPMWDSVSTMYKQTVWLLPLTSP